MEWLNIQECARVLNISERTVYHRIQRGKLQTRQENGKTQVLVECPTDCNDPVGELSKVVAAELGMRAAADATLSEVSETMSRQLATFDRFHRVVETELGHARKSRRVAWSGFVVSLVALGVFAYFHRDRLAQAQADHTEQLAENQSAHQEQLAQVASTHQEQLTAVQVEAAGKMAVLSVQVGELEGKLTEAEQTLERARDFRAMQERVANAVAIWFGGGVEQTGTAAQAAPQE